MARDRAGPATARPRPRRSRDLSDPGCPRVPGATPPLGAPWTSAHSAAVRAGPVAARRDGRRSANGSGPRRDYRAGGRRRCAGNHSGHLRNDLQPVTASPGSSGGRQTHDHHLRHARYLADRESDQRTQGWGVPRARRLCLRAAPGRWLRMNAPTNRMVDAILPTQADVARRARDDAADLGPCPRPTISCAINPTVAAAIRPQRRAATAACVGRGPQERAKRW